MNHNQYASLLFSPASFLEGTARVLDAGGTYDQYNYEPTPAEADHMAMSSDWYAVAADLFHCIDQFSSDHHSLEHS